MNSANEEAVAMFLDGKIGFMDIPATIERVMQAHSIKSGSDINEILEADRWAREQVKKTGS